MKMWRRHQESVMDDRRAVVIDNGSGFLKAGLAGAKEPTVIFPSVVGKKKPRCRRLSLADYYTGEEAVIQRSNVTLRHPLERGVVNQWAEMELLWEHAYDRLQTLPQQQAVLVTESVLSPKVNRRRTVETFLESFRAPSVFVADTSSLCLYADGSTTGLVLESGYSATYAVPIVNGEVMYNAVSKLDLGGNDLSTFLLRLVESRGCFFPPAKREMFAEVKEKLCYVAMDFIQEEEEVKASAASAQSSRIRQSYNLAGDVVTLQIERFQCPESLFQPNWLRVDALGVHQLVHDSIEKCSPDVHGALYENILVTGGSTCFHGFLDRLLAEMDKICPEGTFLKINAPENPKTLAWRGGSEFCLAEHAKDKWITLAEYHEVGEDILERKRGVFHMNEEGHENEADRDVSGSNDSNNAHTRDTGQNALHSRANTTPISVTHKDRKAFPQNTISPGHSQGPTPGPRASKMSLSRGAHSTTPGPGNNRLSSMSINSVTPGLTSDKMVDEVRPKSPGFYENRHFHPTLPKTPELVDYDDGDQLAPLQETSAKGGRGDKQNSETRSDQSGVRKESVTDFASLRKLSLFDHLMDEVAALSPRSRDQTHSEDSEDDLPISQAPRHTSLLDKMKEDQLLPGRGLSGLRRNETINIDSFKKSAGSERSCDRRAESAPDGGKKGAGLSLPVPAIEITSCPTPCGSASLPRSHPDQSDSVQTSPRKIIKFKFSE